MLEVKTNIQRGILKCGILAGMLVNSNNSIVVLLLILSMEGEINMFVVWNTIQLNKHQILPFIGCLVKDNMLDIEAIFLVF